MKPSILIIYTGGTIGMKPDPTTGALVPFDFSGIFEEFPTLQSLNIGIEVFTTWRRSSATTTPATTGSSCCTAPTRCPTPLRP